MSKDIYRKDPDGELDFDGYEDDLPDPDDELQDAWEQDTYTW